MLLRNLVIATLLCATWALQWPPTDISQWTVDTLNAYLETYRIPHPGQGSDENKLVETVKHYRDMTVSNTQLFGNQIDQALKELENKLQQNQQVDQTYAQYILIDLRHRLRNLALHGNLNVEKIAAELDAAKHRATRMRWITEAQWNRVVNDVETAVVTGAWYRRHLINQVQNGFQSWMDQLRSRIKKNKQLTAEEVDVAYDTLQHAIRNTRDFRWLGDQIWWTQVAHELQQNMSPASAQAVVDSIKDQVDGYRVFAVEYLGERYDQVQDALRSIHQWVVQLKDRLYSASQPWWPLRTSQTSQGMGASVAAQSRSLESLVHAATASARSAAHSASHAAAQSSSSLSAEAHHAAHRMKHSFADYWRAKEREAYRRIGYTEAHLDWIQNHLAQSIKDKKSLASHQVDQTLDTLRRFLQEARIQSATHIEHQITGLRNLLEQWKHILPLHNEL